MTADKITVELAQEGEYPPGEEWRGKIREALKLLNDRKNDSDQWVKVAPIEPTIVKRVRSAAFAGFDGTIWDGSDWVNSYQLVTRYDSNTETFWMTQQLKPEGEEE